MNFFSCYLNPWYRFGTENSESSVINWEVGMGHKEVEWSKVSMSIQIEESSSLNMSLYLSDSIILSHRFIALGNDSGYCNYPFPSQFSCSRNGIYNFERSNSSIKIFYTDTPYFNKSLILSGNHMTY